MNRMAQIIICLMALHGILFSQDEPIFIRSLLLLGNESISENEISFVINKNIVILAGNEHNNDITMPIVKILDKELPSLNLK